MYKSINKLHPFICIADCSRCLVFVLIHREYAVLLTTTTTTTMDSLSMKLLVLFLFACWFYLQATAVAADTTHIQTGNMRGVQVYLLPRSQWDPEQIYVPGRVIATRAMLECLRTMPGSTYECAETRPVWHTVVSRDHVWEGFVEGSKRNHQVSMAHVVTLLRSYNNMTYYELPVSKIGMPLDTEGSDYSLVDQARTWAVDSPRKVVLRWDQGRLWRVPMSHWNIGERALHAGSLIRTEWQSSSGAAAHESLPIDMSQAILTPQVDPGKPVDPVTQVIPRPPVVEATPDAKVISTRPPPPPASVTNTATATVNT